MSITVRTSERKRPVQDAGTTRFEDSSRDEAPNRVNADALTAPLSATMDYVVRCFGGPKTWDGRAKGLFGLINRGFTIDSVGEWEENVFVFREKLTFSDGVVERRLWRLWDAPGGVAFEADGAVQIGHGKMERGAFRLDYRLALGQLTVTYADRFFAAKNGETVNAGTAAFLGFRFLSVNAVAKAK